MIFGEFSALHEYAAMVPSVGLITEYVNARKYLDFGQWDVLSDHLKVVRLNKWNSEHDYFEWHSENYDLHLTLAGEDQLFFTDRSSMLEPCRGYDSEFDYGLCEGKVLTRLSVLPMNWVFILHGEPHRNQFAIPGTEKLVFKLKHFSNE